ncbi:RNA polymerase sigma factor SigJ [Streptomyces himalayensis]|uniref:RNA polymerase sigma factor SigJ n=1 Tax=Streptomyces himalayensis subsp. himalayensis TaxID=2756131 RepID=A0A7W0DGL5_9ACTN|nr:RNA polymerase sigma factor SigJ [Streptomyces himalayensis]MBA2944729.1 RNA polymerase sigma factor SigJ [Streptomyces himalayensis subsp. himalayensis]
MSESPAQEPSPSRESSPSRTGAGSGPLHTATRLFVDHRELLFSIVYNMLASVADTEDVLQETWLSLTGRGRRSPLEEIGNPRAYLVRIAVNHALARQAVIRRRRETYVGPWLPEPLVAGSAAVVDAAGGESGDAADQALRTESVSMAMLVILETLTPLERAVFVLNEVFGYAHTEIAAILDRTPSAVRQLAHRAREHVHARRPRFEAHPRVQQEAAERFVAAALGGDMGALMEILAPDVTLWSDGGGKRRSSALRPVHGREKVARLLASYSSRRRPEGMAVEYRRVNGDPSAVVFAGDSPYAVMVMDLTPEGDQVSGVYLVTNPDKLSRVPKHGEQVPKHGEQVPEHGEQGRRHGEQGQGGQP